MAKSTEFTTTLQENVLAVLGFNDENGKIVANLIDPSIFEGDYQKMAERCVSYIHQYGRTLGRAHIRDIISDVLDNPDDKSRITFLQMIDQMYALSQEMDTRYIMDRLSTFVRLQTLKKTTIEVAEKLQSGQEHSITEVEDLWHRILKADTVGFVPGLRMTEVDRVLDFIRSQHTEFYTGIHVLDERQIVPSRGTTDLFIASTGMGKSWWLINIGKQALLQRKKVLHVTLEMSEEEVAGRYYQAFLSIGRSSGKSVVTEFDKDDSGNVHGLSVVGVDSEYNLTSPWAGEELKTYISVTGTLLQNIVIKRFSTGSLTVRNLEAFLDTLERTTGFIPDMVIVDYLGLLYVDARDYRLSLGRTYKDLRGLAGDRNFALPTAHQANRSGAEAQLVGITDVSEDWSLTGTADQVFTYSATPMELRYNLGRIYVGKARNDRDKFTIAISRNYTLGQFCVDGYLIDDDYWGLLKDLNGSDDDDDDSSDRYDSSEDGDEWED